MPRKYAMGHVDRKLRRPSSQRPCMLCSRCHRRTHVNSSKTHLLSFQSKRAAHLPSPNQTSRHRHSYRPKQPDISPQAITTQKQAIKTTDAPRCLRQGQDGERKLHTLQPQQAPRKPETSREHRTKHRELDMARSQGTKLQHSKAGPPRASVASDDMPPPCQLKLFTRLATAAPQDQSTTTGPPHAATIPLSQGSNQDRREIAHSQNSHISRRLSRLGSRGKS